MHAKIHSIAFRGIETITVTVQIHIANGLPAMAIVGLADKTVAILAIRCVPVVRHQPAAKTIRPRFRDQ